VRAVVVAVLIVVVAALSVLAQQLLVAAILFIVVDTAAGRHLIQSRLLARQATRRAAHRALTLRDEVGRRLRGARDETRQIEFIWSEQASDWMDKLVTWMQILELHVQCVI
jgi:hypothetical protein